MRSYTHHWLLRLHCQSFVCTPFFVLELTITCKAVASTIARSSSPNLLYVSSPMFELAKNYMAPIDFLTKPSSDKIAQCHHMRSRSLQAALKKSKRKFESAYQTVMRAGQSPVRRCMKISRVAAAARRANGRRGMDESGAENGVSPAVQLCCFILI